jgi:hypothetical protein
MEDNIRLHGKVAKFPKNSKASKALKFLEHVRVNPNKLWYILIEDQDTELKAVKYNRAKGVNLIEYTQKLKDYYLNEYKLNTEFCAKLNEIQLVGEADFSIIKNIPQLMLENGQTLISKIASDLIKLLEN